VGPVRGYYYRDFGPQLGTEDEEVQARLRVDQMRRALHEASGAFSGKVRPAPEPAVTGQVLDEDDTGGDEARLIDEGEDAAVSIWRTVKLKPDTLRRYRRR